MAAIAVLLVLGAVKLFKTVFLHEKMGTLTNAGDVTVQAELLSVNDNSRPGMRMRKSDVKGIIIHFTGIPGQDALGQRNFYESLKATKQNSLGSHFIVGMKGEIIQCIPINEECCDNGKHNSDMISVMYCHSDETGTPSTETYTSLVKLTAKLLKEFKLDSSHIYLHTEVTGLDIVCPRFYAENPEKWNSFKNDVANYLLTYGKKMK